MAPHPFYLVDVFTQEPLSGNPLALVPDADGIDEATMRRLAREFNQSETTFLLSPTRARALYRLRSFTASGEEVFGAGHNALGAWWWLAETDRLATGGSHLRLYQEIGDAVLGVDVIRRGGHPVEVGMQQSPPEFSAPIEDRSRVADALGIEVSALADHACRAVDTGASHLLVPVSGRAFVDRAAPDSAKLTRVLEIAGAQGCYVYSVDDESGGPGAYTRFFNPTVGIWEDPATGSAAGPLACHLVELGVTEPARPMTIEQGHALGRPSVIQVTVRPDGPVVSGAAVVVAEGSLHLG